MTDATTIDALLDLAGIARNDGRARAELEAALHPAPLPQPGPTPLGVMLANVLAPRAAPDADDDRLDKLRRRAEALIEELHELRDRPRAHTSFWGQDVFGPAEREHTTRKIAPHAESGLERGDVLATLQNIADAAESARRKRGRGRPGGRQSIEVVHRAADFWITFSPRDISGTSTGGFYKFAVKFHEAITGEREADLTHQVREAAKIRPRRREELGRK